MLGGERQQQAPPVQTMKYVTGKSEAGRRVNGLNCSLRCGLGKTNDQMKSLHIPAGGGAGTGARCPRAASGGY